MCVWSHELWVGSKMKLLVSMQQGKDVEDGELAQGTLILKHVGVTKEKV